MFRIVAEPLITVLVAAFVIMASLSLTAGDPVVLIIGDRATEEQYAAVRAELGLDEPFLLRYWHWIVGAVQGDFGQSIVSMSPVSSLIGPRLGTTAALVAYAAVLVIVIGVGLGIFGGLVRRVGPIVTALISFGLALPTLVAAQLLISTFALGLGWFPVLGAGSGFLDRIWHLTLPAFALAVGWSAYTAQITRSSIKDQAGREHVENARARGLSTWDVVTKHVIRNAALPIVTSTGLTVGALIAGAVVVEVAFGIGGIGSLLVDSVGAKDFNVVLAVSVMLVLVFVVILAVIDGIHCFLDPRIRHRGGNS